MLIGRHSVARERAYIERDILTQLGRNWWMLVVVLNESRNDIVADDVFVEGNSRRTRATTARYSIPFY